MIKVSEDSMKKGAITVRKYCDDHKCEKNLGPQGAAPFLTQSFIDEFGDNQKMGLQTFAAKIHRKFNLSQVDFKAWKSKERVTDNYSW
jgi:hypothetical protein